MIARTPTASATYAGFTGYALTGEALLQHGATSAAGYARYMRESANVAAIAQRVAQLLDGRDVGDSEDIESVFQRAADELGIPFEPVPSDVMLTGRKITYTGMKAVRRDGGTADASMTAPAGLPVIRSGVTDIVRADGSVPVQAGEVAYIFGASARQSWWDKYWSVVVVVAIGGSLFALAALAPAVFTASAATSGTTAATSGAATSGVVGTSGALGVVSQVAGVASVGAGVTQAIRQAMTDPPPPVAAPVQAGLFGSVPLWAWLGVGLAAAVFLVPKGGR